MDLSILIQDVTKYIDILVGGNEFAGGVVIAAVMGYTTYVCRSLPKYIYTLVKKHTTTSMTLNSTQVSFHKCMKFLMKEGLSKRSRVIKISNGHYWDDDDDIPIKEIGYGNHYFKFRKNILHISLVKEDTVANAVKEFITITKVGRSHKLFDDILEAMLVRDDVNESTEYYKYNSGKHYICEQPKRRLDNIILSTYNREKLFKTIDTFISKEDWYLKYEIPYQFGLLLYGPPGTGKTSLIRAIAGYLDKSITYVDSMDGLINASQEIKNSVIVVEEIDTFGLGKRDVDDDDDVSVPAPISVSENSSRIKNIKRKNRKEDISNKEKNVLLELTQTNILGKILNSLDGIMSNHGRIIIMTSNHVDQLDPALLRPGRIDIKLALGYLDKQMFSDMLIKFFPESRNTIESVVYSESTTLKHGLSAAVLQNDIISNMTLKDILDEYVT